MLQAEPTEPEQPDKLAPAWDDAPLDPKWAAVDADTKTTIEAAHGIVDRTVCFLSGHALGCRSWRRSSRCDLAAIVRRECGLCTRDTANAWWRRCGRATARRWTARCRPNCGPTTSPETTAATGRHGPRGRGRIREHRPTRCSMQYSGATLPQRKNERRLAVGMTEHELATTADCDATGGARVQKTLQVVDRPMMAPVGTRRSGRTKAKRAPLSRIVSVPSGDRYDESLADISFAPIGTAAGPAGFVPAAIGRNGRLAGGTAECCRRSSEPSNGAVLLDQPEQSLADLDYLVAQTRSTYQDLQLLH